MLFRPPEPAGFVEVAPVSSVPIQLEIASPRESYTERLMVPPGDTTRFSRFIPS